MTSSYSTVTVVYEGDAMLLTLQARSMARHADPGLFSEIVVIDNTCRGMSRSSVASLRAEYGPLAPLVTVVAARRLLPGSIASGWWGQQLLKIVVASSLRTDRYLVLDAKNLVVRRLGRDFLEGPDGRPRMPVQAYGAHPLLERLKVSLRWWGIDPEPHVPRFGSTVTPFVMETALVAEMVTEVERRTGTSFVSAFRAQDVTEFFFYLGWLCVRGRLEDRYHLERVRCPALWPARADLATLMREIDESQAGLSPVFTVHQRALKDLDDACTGALAAFWTRSGLFACTAEAARFVADFRGVWHRPSTRVAVLRSRALGLARRLGQPRASAPGSRARDVVVLRG